MNLEKTILQRFEKELERAMGNLYYCSQHEVCSSIRYQSKLQLEALTRAKLTLNEIGLQVHNENGDNGANSN